MANEKNKAFENGAELNEEICDQELENIAGGLLFIDAAGPCVDWKRLAEESDKGKVHNRL